MSLQQVTQAVAAAQLTAAVATPQVFVSQINASVAAVLNVPGSGRLNGKKFTVRASGFLTTVSGATTASPFIAVGSSPLIANDTVIAQPAGATVATTSCPWWLELNLQYDNISGKLAGNFSSMVNNVISASAPLSTVITGLSGTTEPVFSLVAGMQFSTNTPGNIAGLAEFVLEE